MTRRICFVLLFIGDNDGDGRCRFPPVTENACIKVLAMNIGPELSALILAGLRSSGGNVIMWTASNHETFQLVWSFMVCFIHHTLFDDSKATMMGHNKFWTLFYSVQNNTAVEIIREAKTLLGLLCVSWPAIGRTR